MREHIYSGLLKLNGEEHVNTIKEAICYAIALVVSGRFKDTQALMCKSLPAARRGLGESNELTLKMSGIYAAALYRDDRATLDDLREAVTTLEDVERIARRVLGGAHPTTESTVNELRYARAMLRARETPPASQD